MKEVLFIAIFMACTFSLTFHKIESKGDKVKIDLYYESLCPFCEGVVTGPLKQAANTKVKI